MCKKVCGNCKYSTNNKAKMENGESYEYPVCHLIGVDYKGEEEFDIDDYLSKKDDYMVYVTSLLCGNVLPGKELDMLLWVELMDKVEKCIKTNLQLRVAWYEGKVECEMWEGK